MSLKRNHETRVLVGRKMEMEAKLVLVARTCFGEFHK
jgi:hypothetical protein